MKKDDISAAIDATFAAYSNGDLEGFANSFAEDLHYEDTGGGSPIKGREAFKTYAAGWLEACPDSRLQPVRKIIAEQEAAVELRFTGTHSGAPMYGLEPTGAAIDFHFATTMRLSDGLVTELKAWYSPLTTMQAVGLIDELPTRPAG